MTSGSGSGSGSVHDRRPNLHSLPPREEELVGTEAANTSFAFQVGRVICLPQVGKACIVSKGAINNATSMLRNGASLISSQRPSSMVLFTLLRVHIHTVTFTRRLAHLIPHPHHFEVDRCSLYHIRGGRHVLFASIAGAVSFFPSTIGTDSVRLAGRASFPASKRGGEY